MTYAVELGIDVRIDSDRSTEARMLRIGDGLLHEEAAEIRSWRYELVNRACAAQTVPPDRRRDRRSRYETLPNPRSTAPAGGSSPARRQPCAIGPPGSSV